MPKGGKREMAPGAWKELPPVDVALVTSALRRAPTSEQMAALEAVRRDVERAHNAFAGTALASKVDQQRDQLKKALKTLARVFQACDQEPGLMSALAGLMRERGGSGRHEAEKDLEKLRLLGARIQDRLRIGAKVPRTQTAAVHPQTFCVRVLLERLIPIARSWDMTKTEMSPRFVDLVHAFGLYHDRSETQNAIKNNRLEVFSGVRDGHTK